MIEKRVDTAGEYSGSPRLETGKERPLIKRPCWWMRLALIAPISILASTYAGLSALHISSPYAELRASSDLRMSLLRHPLDAPALRRLALDEGTAATETIEILRLASKVSRRDRDTQLFLLEAEAQAGNNAASLRHYDALLLTGSELNPDLLGILASGLPDPRLRSALLPYADRSWFLALIRRAARPDRDPIQAFVLMQEAGWLKQPDRRDAITPVLLEALSEPGQNETAIELADSLALRGWRDLGFTEATLDRRLGPLSWQLETSGLAAAQWLAPDTLTVSVEPLHDQIVARRQTLFASGTYRLAFVAENKNDLGAELEWHLTCPSKLTATVVATPRAHEPGTKTAQFAMNIDIDCPRQMWALRVKGDDVSRTAEINISNVKFERVQ